MLLIVKYLQINNMNNNLKLEINKIHIIINKKINFLNLDNL